MRYYQNNKPLNFCTEITFIIPELYQFQRNGPLIMTNQTGPSLTLTLLTQKVVSVYHAVHSAF